MLASPGLEGAQGGHYIPAWFEVMITLMLIAVGFSLIAVGFSGFSLAVRDLDVYPRDDAQHECQSPSSAPLTLRRTVTTTHMS
jgi:hypothetical protein